MKKSKKIFNQPKIAIFFYAMAILYLSYTVYTLYTSYTYISGLVTAGSITWGSSVGDIVGYFVSNSSSYLFYSFAFIFFGYACNYLNPKAPIEEVSETTNTLHEEVSEAINTLHEEVSETINTLHEEVM